MYLIIVLLLPLASCLLPLAYYLLPAPCSLKHYSISHQVQIDPPLSPLIRGTLRLKSVPHNCFTIASCLLPLASCLFPVPCSLFPVPFGILRR
ncbi:hypothetical protein [Moorena producens]|uniref:hypothetical protein n=1 Tax=Moorena producens TaxID=1155739 RepID=UPI0011EA6C76|nr:hypothetical protein [Moorena producens]